MLNVKVLLIVVIVVAGFIALCGTAVNAADCQTCNFSPGKSSTWTTDPDAGQEPECDPLNSSRDVGWCVLGSPGQSCSEAPHYTTHMKAWTFHDIPVWAYVAADILRTNCILSCAGYEPCMDDCQDDFQDAIDVLTYCDVVSDEYSGINNGCL